MKEVFPDVNGPHGWVHLRILISVVVSKDGEHIFTYEIIIVRNKKKVRNR